MFVDLASLELLQRYVDFLIKLVSLCGRKLAGRTGGFVVVTFLDLKSRHSVKGILTNSKKTSARIDIFKKNLNTSAAVCEILLWIFSWSLLVTLLAPMNCQSGREECLSRSRGPFW